MARGAVIIRVNEAVWEGLPHHEHILLERLGCIEKVKGTSPRLIERVLPETNKAIGNAECEIELADEMDLITFYSKALSLLLWVRDKHSGPNRDMVRQLMKDRIKAIHPFPYVYKCLPIACWNDPMWNPEGFNPSIFKYVKIHYKNELEIGRRTNHHQSN